MNVLRPDNLLASGAEHHVYRQKSQAGDTVLKVPAPWAQWQDMSAAAAQADLETLAHYEIPHVPTRVIANPMVEDEKGVQRKVSYALEQPFKTARPLRVGDFADPRIGQQTATLFERSQRLYRREGMGVDLVGMAVVPDLLQILYKGRINAAIHNLLVSEENGIPVVELCDTRLFNPDGFHPFIRSPWMASNRLQHDLVGRALNTAGYSVECAHSGWAAPWVGAVAYPFLADRIRG